MRAQHAKRATWCFRQGKIKWLDNTALGKSNADQTLRIVKRMAVFFRAAKVEECSATARCTQRANVLRAPLNESDYLGWYRESHAGIRKTLSALGLGNGPLLVYHDGFMGLDKWPGFAKNFTRSVMGKERDVDVGMKR